MIIMITVGRAGPPPEVLAADPEAAAGLPTLYHAIYDYIHVICIIVYDNDSNNV